MADIININSIWSKIIIKIFVKHFFTIKSVIAHPSLPIIQDRYQLFFQIESALSQECPLWKPFESRGNSPKRWSRTVQSHSGSGELNCPSKPFQPNICLAGWRRITTSATTPRGDTGGAPSWACRPHGTLLLSTGWNDGIFWILLENKNIAQIWSLISFY